MRDAQVEAIKTWLFLKLACGNRPLCDLFTEGVFNTADLDTLPINTTTRAYLQQHPASAALYECASFQTEGGAPFSPKLRELLCDAPETVDAAGFFHQLFYGVSYTDYLFSLPMGAGKTWLMAAFIYLDLYFAENEPDNPAFAHNFIIFAPSGLKSSVIPSLKTIQKFDPAWIIPEPAASGLKRKLLFELLDQNKSESKSNRAKNPNVQKIAIHQPLHELFGLVAVTNAEKVILNSVDIDERNGQPQLIEKTEDEKDRQANELRNLLGKLPNLSVFIDEVHHAATDDKKLRAVVNQWMENRNLNSVIGFSGTPYLPKDEKLTPAPGLTISLPEISNIVSYYPLAEGIGNFLKCPVVCIAEGMTRLEIIEKGIRDFLNTHRNTTYADGTCAKLGIYCSAIDTLEEEVYPLAARLAEEYGISPVSGVLRYHGGNKRHSCSQDSRLQFASLDQSFSPVRIILLAQIGKEGWDCRSLTGIILSQEGDCPRNMVLQTACRCLRQVQKGTQQQALIVLNEQNGSLLKAQLRRQHHLTIDEFQRKNAPAVTHVERFDRSQYLRLPSLDFYQLKVSFHSLVIDTERDTDAEIAAALTDDVETSHIIRMAELGYSLTETGIETEHQGRPTQTADFNCWLGMIAKESFGFVTMAMLRAHEKPLRQLFQTITCEKDGLRMFDTRYQLSKLNANIRKAFYEKRQLQSVEELLPEDARLLKVEKLTSPVATTRPDTFFPPADDVRKIIAADQGELTPNDNTLEAIRLLEASGQGSIAATIRRQFETIPGKDRSYHYLPYKSDSDFEQLFLTDVLKLDCIEQLNLEVYYNGDRALTDFRIKCYKWHSTRWNYIGSYTPDFLIIQRQGNTIHKAMIVETKGSIYAQDATFRDKRDFVQGVFLEKNNQQSGYRRFDYLYLEDSLPATKRITATSRAIETFFKK